MGMCRLARWGILALSCAPNAQSPAEALGRPKARIMLVGTFHFRDAGLDDFKPQHQLDIASPERQTEIAAVVEQLARFGPTVVAVEWPFERQDDLDDEFAQFLRADRPLPPNEVYQLGFRLAKASGVDRVHAVDARGRAYDPVPDPTVAANEHGLEYLLESPWYEKFEAAARHEDALKTELTIGAFLRQLNDPDRVRASHGVYLVGSFKVSHGTDYPGADSKTRWYNRNLRIFANLQRVTALETERIALVIGAGHLPILRLCVEASPEYALVEANDYLDRQAGPAIEGLVGEHTYELGHDGELSGPGAEFLLREARAARFVSLAEPHNVKEVPELTTMLMRHLHERAGYDYLALEQGSAIVRRLGVAARAGVDEAVAVARRYASALHFRTDQELRMIFEVARIDGAAFDRVWGVDRSLDAVPALEELRDRAPSELLDDLLERARAIGGRALLRDPDDPFAPLLGTTDEPRARFLAERLRNANRHLVLNARADREPLGYTANGYRETEMMRLFADFLSRAEVAGGTPPKVLLKSGHWHLKRGHNPSRLASLGQMLAGVAQSEGSDAFMINIQPINRSGRLWSLTDYPEYAPLTQAGSPDAWRLIDLRPLRDPIYAGRFRVHEQLEELIFGFDALLLLGGASRGTTELLR